MGIRKFRSVAEMPGPPPRPPLDPENLRLACELSRLAFALRPWRYPPGVHKYRSIEEANRARETWERAGAWAG
jgi:hypothetical protein